MSGPMMQTTGKFADIFIRVPAAHATKVCAVIENLLALIPGQAEWTETDDDRLYTVEEVFPEGIRAGEVLSGARFREVLKKALPLPPRPPWTARKVWSGAMRSASSSPVSTS